MRRIATLLSLCLVTVGCDGVAGAGAGASAGQASTDSVGAPPQFLGATSLALYSDIINGTDKVSIGDKLSAAEVVFPSPTKKRVLATTLPKGFSADDYAATGWQLGDGSQGAGFITDVRTRAIVCAMVRQSCRDSVEADNIVAAYREKLRPIVPARLVYGSNTFTFWDDGNDRLMILEGSGKGSAVQLTLILGVKSIMDFLHADPSHSRIDADRAAALSDTKAASSGT